MLKLSPCVEMLWKDVAFPERIKRAAAVGYKAYEFWGWWDKDLDAIERAAKDTGLATAVCCVNSPWSGEDSMVNKGSAKTVAKAVKECIPVGKRLGCSTFIITTGNELKGVPRDDQHKACVAAMKAAAKVAEDAGLTLVLEPLNIVVDHKGYYLSSSAEAFQMIKEVDSPAVKILFDIYHQQVGEGNVVRNITRNIDKIGHFHVADNPGRNEPGTGEMNYQFILSKIAESGYQGHVGLEFSATDPARTDDIMRNVLGLAEV